MAFEDALVTIENKDMRDFARVLIKTIPLYFFEVPASSTGKYHPMYALGAGGLYRHTLAVVKFVNYFFEIDCFKNRWDSRGRDIMRIAAIMHDSFKSGSQKEYAKSKYTKHDHPLIAASNVLNQLGCGIIPDEEIKEIAKAIGTHMGQFTTSPRSDVILPEPKDKTQQMLHLADYLASRKDIEVLFLKQDGK